MFQLLGQNNRLKHRGLIVDRSHPLSRGLVFCALLAESAGEKVQDYSLNVSPGTLENMAATEWTASTAGPVGRGLRFDGTNDRVNFGGHTNFNSSDSFSVEVWFRSNIDSTNRTIIGKVNSSTAGWHMRMVNTNVIRFILISSGGNYVNSDTVTALSGIENWWHCIGTYDGTGIAAGIKTYLNGLLDSSSALSGTVGTTTNADTLFLGFDNEPSSGYFSGDIGLARIWNRALSADQVRSLYKDPLGMFVNRVRTMQHLHNSDTSTSVARASSMLLMFS